MSVEMMLYLSSVAGAINGSCAFLSLISMLVFAGANIVFYQSEDGSDDRKFAKLWIKMFSFIIPILLILATFVPSEKTMHLITAVRASKEIINGSPIPEKILRLLNKKLDEELKDSKHE